VQGGEAVWLMTSLDVSQPMAALIHHIDYCEHSKHSAIPTANILI